MARAVRPLPHHPGLVVDQPLMRVEHSRMLLHPALEHARTLMVVGAPRCGTRFAANALNRHPSILVMGEIPEPAMDHAVRLIEDNDRYFASMPKWSAGWQRNRDCLLYQIWASLAKGSPRLRGKPLSWFGHKTPRHDQYWEFYESRFENLKPNYVFCMRNFIDHYLSLQSMKHKDSIETVSDKYRASVNRYAGMKAALGARVSLFILDDLRTFGIDYVRQTLFEPLAIELDERTMSRIDVSLKANSTEGAGRTRRRELTDQEHEFLHENKDLLEALPALREARPLATASPGIGSWWKKAVGIGRRVPVQRDTSRP